MNLNLLEKVEILSATTFHEPKILRSVPMVCGIQMDNGI